jgi:hypothetical protein
MRVSALLPLAATILPILAQTSISENSTTVQSPDFNLVIQSHNKTLDGKLLGACHDGAAHEGVCIVDNSFPFDSTYVNFQWNTTVYSCTETNSSGTFNVSCNFSGEPEDPTLTTGIVTWWMHFSSIGGGTSSSRISQALVLDTVYSSNVALAQIAFADEYEAPLYVAFDKDDLMNIQQYTDDTLEPAYEYLNARRPLYRWNICQTYYTGYHYTALTWVLGERSAQNPTCAKVNVKRVFV